MGLPMAARIAHDGFDLTAVDLNSAQVAKAVELGLAASVDPEDLVDCDILLVVVATGTQLLSIADRPLLARESAVRIVVVLSTVGVAAIQEFAALVTARGMAVVDAPITGGVRGAETGGLILFAAGDTEAVELIRPVVASLGRLLVCGNRVGNGQSFKLVNQLLAASHLAIAGEAVAFSRALGLDPALVLDAVTTGAGGSWMLADRGPRMIEDAASRPTQTHLSILLKDAGLVEEAAAEIGFDARILRQAATEFRTAEANGWAAADDSFITDVDHTVRGVVPRG